MPILDEGQLAALREIELEWNQLTAAPQAWREVLPARLPPGAYKPRQESRSSPGPDRRPNTDISAVPPANDADTPGLTARR